MTPFQIALIAFAAAALALLAVPVVVGSLTNDKEKGDRAYRMAKLLIKPFVALTKWLLGSLQL